MPRAATNKSVKVRNKHNKPQLSEAEKLAIRATKGTGSSRAIAREYGVSDFTVRAIWNDAKYEDKTLEISRIKKDMADDFLLVVDAGRTRVMDTIDDASVSQAATVMGIAYDKYRLETNQATANVSVNAWQNICNKVEEV